MDIWEQRKRFKEAVAAFRKASGKRLQEVAELLGLKESTLKDYLYREDVRPSLQVLQQAAALFGCSVTEFIDDPGAQIAGLDPGDLGQLSAAKRAVMNMVFQRLKHGDVTDEQAMQYLKGLDVLVELGKVRKPRFD